ncbi:uncharacterized protein [Panulirus ornatus]|uniref:uncharacterized protein n=1 Tax=Panulirus ornatus TaxID=150431 RepID=UPI003A8787BA
MYLKLVACVVLCASLAAAMPQATEALRQETGEPGAQEKLVADTSDIFPEIADALGRIRRYMLTKPQKAPEVIRELLPLTRKVFLNMVDVESRGLPKDVPHRINAAEVATPHLSTFRNWVRHVNFSIDDE